MIFGHTWRYVCFGRPGNKEEFLQDMKAERILGLDIIMGADQHNYFGGLKVKEYFPILNAKERELELRDISRLGASPKERSSARSEVFDTMLELASYFKTRDFRATINGKPAEEATENDRQIYSERSRGIIQRILQN